MPVCYFTEFLCGKDILLLYKDIERIVETYDLWTAMAASNYELLEDFIFSKCDDKGAYSGALFTFIIGQFHISAQIGWDAWTHAVSESSRV